MAAEARSLGSRKRLAAVNYPFLAGIISRNEARPSRNGWSMVPTVPSERAGASHTLIRYWRVVVKAGTNVLTNGDRALDHASLASLVAQVVHARQLGAQVVLVTSGAVAAGREAIGSVVDSSTVAGRQMMAAVGQSRLMHQYAERFAEHGCVVAQALLTRQDIDDRQGYLNIRNTLEGLLLRGIVPIVNENDVVNAEEIGEETFGDNDQLSALVANLVDADLLVLLTDSGGLYTADPRRDPGARLMTQVPEVNDAVLALAEPHRGGGGRGGMRSKLLSSRLATSFGVTVVIGGGSVPEVLPRAVRGEPVGTLFPATVSRMESRKRWMLSGLGGGGGSVSVDEGAVVALRGSNRSLLPAGVRNVIGAFLRGDLVPILGPTGLRVAVGLANYDSEDVRRIMGRRSDEIETLLGYHHGEEVVHRNNMVVW